MLNFLLAISTPTLNKFFGVMSAISGVGMVAAAPFLHDLATGFSGIGALSFALVMFQLSDVRERLQRVEACLMEGDDRPKHHHHAAGK